ncbi:Predicted arabinose efflux permease, MFS family [Pseudomonas libanensis]|uniref:MFS transporter n=1 Tax=Pseudomonas libanensis TaxID=75588 RepID=A0A0R2YFW7_9PSED|nr:MFS transporter [Pseudomonas libanensis]KRP45827.1 MFS transporter [Pseudomonas libanensis]SDK80989.1 Predicted arabinose efflux permease, MFS family [Pseudomonas libanensis]
MPAVIYIFSLCTFTFGLSEFVVAGLVSAISVDLHESISHVGSAIAAYALGAAIGAPIITALLANWRDKTVLLLTLGVLAAGSVVISLAPDILTLHGVRFIIGLAHGVFMAVASNAAVKLVDPIRAGRALSLVWMGLTLSVAFGVPIGTFLGSYWSWRIVFLAIGGLGLISTAGLALLMRRRRLCSTHQATDLKQSFAALLHRELLVAATIAMLVSVATFSFFTFVSPFLLDITRVQPQILSLAMLVFGVCSILGNLLGGYLVDAFDADRCLLGGLTALMLNLLSLYVWGDSMIATLMLVGLLGVVFFAIVTMSTLRLLRLAHHYVAQSSSVASGLNIAAFNLGTALGGIGAGWIITHFGLAFIPIAGVGAALVAIGILSLQMKSKLRPS